MVGTSTMKKAIDIVLLPPENVMDILIDINKAGKRDDGRVVVMNKKNMLPHLTLAMANIDEVHLEKIKEIISKLASGTKPIEVELFQEGKTYYGLGAKKENFKNLFEQIVEAIEPYNSHDADRESIFEEDKDIMEQRHLDYINRFTIDQNFEIFNPHVTTHSRNLAGHKLPIKFTADRLAICHLGFPCTCREILFETKLKK